METKSTQLGWGFWLQWVFYNVVGGFLALFLSLLTSILLMGLFLDVQIGPASPASNAAFAFIASAASGAIEGMLIGISQWVVLRRRFPQIGWWILASMVGYAVGGGLSAVFESLAFTALPITIVGLLSSALLGFALGISQWLVLRQHLTRAGWWIFATTLAFSVGSMILDGVLLPVVVGALTGVMLVWLSQQKQEQ